MRNTKTPTGGLEVLVKQLRIFNPAGQVPVNMVNTRENDQNEEFLLTHRHLALRMPILQRNLRLRSAALHSVRNFLVGQQFVDVETPTLFKSTPEGAREFLVPTRNPNQFYALTQSPQQYKQLLMVAGVDRW